jgi:hypothetical protein
MLESTERCPNCRKFIHKRDGHPVYLELVETVATDLIEAFDRMNADTSLSSLKKASVKLGLISKKTTNRVVVSVLLFFLKHANHIQIHSNRHPFRAQSKSSIIASSLSSPQFKTKNKKSRHCGKNSTKVAGRET